MQSMIREVKAMGALDCLVHSHTTQRFSLSLFTGFVLNLIIGASSRTAGWCLGPFRSPALNELMLVFLSCGTLSPDDKQTYIPEIKCSFATAPHKRTLNLSQTMISLTNACICSSPIFSIAIHKYPSLRQSSGTKLGKRHNAAHHLNLCGDEPAQV